MKKILLVSHAMEIGGAERALLGLLENVDTSRYQVDLFLLRHEGELLSLIPEKINLLPEIPEYTVLARPMKQTLKEDFVRLTLARAYGKWKAKQFDRKHGYSEAYTALEYSHKYTKSFMPPIMAGTEYDLAISFLTPHYFVAEKVRAKKRIAWIHTDYSFVQIDTESERKMWAPYDHIASISEDVTKGFLTKFLSLADKVVLIENILPKTLIEKQAQDEPDTPISSSDRMSLLSVGRFSYPKNFDNVPDICRRLVELGCDVNWYLIGYGQDEALIRQKIEEAGMQDRVIILGKKENPYPYIKACDLYVQPSRYEGKCVAVREAQMLGKPVVITDYPTAGSQLENGVDGVVVPLDNEKCAEGIANLLSDPKRIQMLIENCRNRDYTNSAEIRKLEKLLT